jgi:hypothetical protein
MWSTGPAMASRSTRRRPSASSAEERLIAKENGADELGNDTQDSLRNQ